jgi:hypothetical protein
MAFRKIRRFYVNYCQLSFRLKSKTRDGSRVQKRYHRPATPYERLLAHASVPSAVKDTLECQLAALDPLELLHQIQEGQAALAALSSDDPGQGPQRESLEAFFAKLPDLWRQGEARPTHRSETTTARWWRTRDDPLACVD